MHTADSRLFNWIALPFLALRANHKHANRSIIRANQGDILAYQSADFHYE